MREDIRSITGLVQNPILGKHDYPRFLSIKQLQLQIEAFELHNFRLLTETDQQIGFKLFDLSISRHSEVKSVY